MTVTFKDRKLAKIAHSKAKLIAKYGKARGTKLKLRLDDLLTATTLEDVRHLPGNYHELTQNRKGQWACSLDGAYRLIFTPREDPIPTDEDGKYIWVEILGVEVIEIINYHKEG